MIEEKLPDIFKLHAFHPSHFIYAFKRSNLEKLFDELLQSNIAIESVEVWLVEKGLMLKLIPLKNGDVKNFDWKIEARKGEEWYDFVERSIKEATDLINNWNLEGGARLDKVRKIWYHFEFLDNKTTN